MDILKGFREDIDIFVGKRDNHKEEVRYTERLEAL